MALLFSLVSVLLWAYPAHALWIFPAYGILLAWADMWKENEMQILFVFLVTMAGLLLLSRPPHGFSSAVYAAGVLGELAGIWGTAFALSARRRKNEKALQKLHLEINENNKAIQDVQREIESYSRHQQSLLHQTRLQSNLSEAVQLLAGAMNMEDIRARLVNLMGQYFPGSSCQLVSGAPRDNFENWALEHKMPLLVPNADQDKRFSVSGPRPQGEKSLIVIPLHVLQTTAGFIKLASPEAGTFQTEDLRTADLLGTLAALSMENAHLYYKVQELAIHDGLTRLFTHRAFQQRLQEEILRAGRSQVPFSMFICDIDHFKRYNDTFGHQAGDQVLKTVASLLVRHTREIDFVARYGGEEFAVILPAVSKAQAAEAAEKMRSAISSEPFVFEGSRTNVTMSFGVSSFPQDAAIASQLVRAADERLYRAKEGGRNQVVLQ